MAKKTENVIDELDNLLFGSNTGTEVIKPSEDEGVKNWYSVGNYAINYCMSKRLRGGVPAGRITAFEGLSGTGKSLLTTGVMKDPNIDMVIIIETEGGGNSKELLEYMGVPLEKVRIIKAHTFTSYRIDKKTGKREEVADKDVPQKLVTDTYVYVEGVTKIVKDLLSKISMSKVSKDKKLLIVLDSLANLQSVRELNGTADMGKRAQDIGIFFRCFDNSIEKTNTAFIFTNKLYTNIGNEYDPWKTAGGENVIYNPSIIMRTSKTADSSDVTEKDKKEEKENKTGGVGSNFETMNAVIRKSRFGTRGKKCQFMVETSTGLVKHSGLFKLLNDYGIIERSGGAWYVCPVLFGDKKFQKTGFLDLFIEKEEEYLDILQAELDKREIEIRQKKLADIETVTDEAVERENEIDEALDFDEASALSALVNDLE